MCDIIIIEICTEVVNLGVYVVIGSFIIFDVLTGLLKAFKHNNIDSTVLREGLLHKISEILVAIGSGLLPYGLTYINFNIDLPVLPVVAVYICLMELVSSIENLCDVNPQLADLFGPYLKKIKDTQEKKE